MPAKAAPSLPTETNHPSPPSVPARAPGGDGGGVGGGEGAAEQNRVFTHKHDLINGAGAERTHLHAKDFSFF